MSHAALRSAASIAVYPLRPVLLLFILFFTIGFTFAAMAGMFGLPLFALLALFFAKYVFVIVESSAQGHRDPPVLSYEMISPFSERRPALLLGLIMILAGIAGWLGAAFGRNAMLLFLWCAALLLPASIALLTVEERLLPALDPWRMLKLAAALRWHYVLLWLSVAACVSLLALAPAFLDNAVVTVAACIYVVLLCAHAFGRVLYRNRDAIGLDVEVDPDRVTERLEKARLRQIERVLGDVWLQTRQGKLRAAYAALLEGAEAERFDVPERLVVHERLLGWDDKSLALAHARDSVGALVRAGETRAAWRMCADCLRADPRFKPAEAEAAFVLAKHAFQGGDRTQALLLLEDFDLHYEGRGPVQAAALLAVRALDGRDEVDRIVRIVERMRQRFGEAGLTSELAAHGRAAGERAR